MTFLIPTAQQAHAGLRAFKSTLARGGDLPATHREALSAVQKHLLRTDFDLDTLAPIEPEELAGLVTDRALREQFVSALVTFTMLSEHVDPAHADAVDAYAKTLGVAPPVLRELRDLAEQRYWRLRFDVIRRGPGPDAMKKVYERDGALGVVKNVLGFAGLLENTEVADRYRALSSYPEGSLGKTLFDFYTARSFKFPGEKGGAPEGLLPHDLSHVLGGYDTDMRGEGQVLAFTAGYRREKVFDVLSFVLVQAQHGVRLTPLAEAYEGFLSTPHLVTEMVEAFARGNKCSVDLMGDWDFWAVMDRPVAELREEYGIGPAPAPALAA
jgi:hypothetical protein